MTIPPRLTELEQGLTLSEALEWHLSRCQPCAEASKGRPVGLGQKPRMCPEWFEIIREYADYEGIANNVVAPTRET